MDCILVALFLVYYWGCSAYSIVAPFYPAVARDKSMTDWEIGVLFALFPLTAFIASPAIGRLMQCIGRKAILVSAGLIEAAGIVGFGLVIFLDGYFFLAASYLARILQGIGAAGLFISVLSTIANRYPDDIETKLGIVETFGSLGLIVGPAMGGLLYMFVGYRGVFFICGALFTVALAGVATVLPSDKPKREAKLNINYREYLKLRPIALALGAVMFGMAGLTFIEPVQAIHLKLHSEMDPVLIAAMFALPTTGYAVAIKAQSMVRTRVSRKYFLAAGLLFEALGLSMLCQTELTRFQDTLFLSIPGLLLLGTGSALAFLPSLPFMVDTAVAALDEGSREEHNDALSAVMAISHYCGETVGPLLAGSLVDLIGFQCTFLTFSGITLVYAAIYCFLTQSVHTNLSIELPGSIESSSTMKVAYTHTINEEHLTLTGIQGRVSLLSKSFS